MNVLLFVRMLLIYSVHSIVLVVVHVSSICIEPVELDVNMDQSVVIE